MSKPRRQCKHCPWKISSNPRDIPGGYCEAKHEGLASTIAQPGELRPAGGLKTMACHETHPGKEIACVGWIENQMGRGNNLALRMAAIAGRIDVNVETVGPQHERFEDTLPQEER